MKVRIPSPKEVRQKIIDHPYITYYGFLTAVMVGSYAVARKLSSTVYDPYDYVIEDMYNHMKAGDNLVVTYDDEQFYYIPDPDRQAS